MKNIAKINDLNELEQARRANIHAELPDNEKAVIAERLGDYQTARVLWLKVANQLKNKDNVEYTYAHQRYKFCASAVAKGYKRPELSKIGA